MSYRTKSDVNQLIKARNVVARGDMPKIPIVLGTSYPADLDYNLNFFVK